MFADAPPTVARVDLRRYLGGWFEIARLPTRFQSEDCTDVTAEYTLGDGDALRIRNQCTLCDGRTRDSTGEAWPIDASHARLKVSFLPEGLRWLPFTRGDYWILLLDEAYSISLVGTPNRRALWLLSRTRHPEPALRDGYLAHAEALGYDLTPLIHTPHRAPDRIPATTHPTPSPMREDPQRR